MRELILHEHDFCSVEQLHQFLKRELQFPAHYGENFAALSDCLGDISQPTRLVVYRDNSVAQPWFDKACAVMGRASLENPSLEAHFK